MTITERTLGQFLEDIASSQITPSAGAVAAVGGAMGAALCEMVCIHTESRDEDTPSLAAADELATHRKHLLALADEDSAAVDALESTLVDEPADTNAAAERATDVPVAVAERCRSVLECATVVVATGNERALADGVTGALFAHSALRSAAFTARTNVDALTDDSVIAETEARIDATEAGGTEALELIVETVDNEL